MPKKIKLNLEDLNVKSFKTIETKGGADVGPSTGDNWSDCLTLKFDEYSCGGSGNPSVAPAKYCY